MESCELFCDILQGYFIVTGTVVLIVILIKIPMPNCNKTQQSTKLEQNVYSAMLNLIVTNYLFHRNLLFYLVGFSE